MADRTLIDQALAIVEEAQPVGLSDEIPLTPEQALVWTVYLAAQDRDAGRGSVAEVKRTVDLAGSAGIAEAEIDAALAAA